MNIKKKIVSNFKDSIENCKKSYEDRFKINISKIELEKKVNNSFYKNTSEPKLKNYKSNKTIFPLSPPLKSILSKGASQLNVCSPIDFKSSRISRSINGNYGICSLKNFRKDKNSPGFLRVNQNPFTIFDDSIYMRDMKIDFKLNSEKISLKKLLPLSQSPLKSSYSETIPFLSLYKDNHKRKTKKKLISVKRTNIIYFDNDDPSMNKTDKQLIIDSNKEIKSKVFYSSIKEMNFNEIFYKDIHPSKLSKVNSHLMSIGK